MKLIFLTLLLTFTLSNCFLRVPDLGEIFDNKRPIDNLEAFWSGFFKQLGLEKPTELVKCFNDRTAALFFLHINDLSELFEDTEERRALQVKADFLTLLGLYKGLESTLVCVNQTEDYLNVLKALHIKENKPELFEKVRYVDYQANYGWLAKEFPSIVAAVNSGNYFCAGELHASLVNGTVSWLNETGIHLNILKAFQNGVSLALGLPDSESVLECWDDESALVKLELILGLAKNVSEGAVNEASYNTENWFKEVGGKLAKKIPEKTWKCWESSKDLQWESKALNTNVTSPDFYQKINKFVHSQQPAYWKFEKAIKEGFESLNLLDAGAAYGGFLQAVARYDEQQDIIQILQRFL